MGEHRDPPPLPPLPSLRDPQRARLLLEFDEAGGHTKCGETGWAVLAGPWVVWCSDENDFWQAWPAQHVVCLEWAARPEPATDAREGSD